MGVQDDDSSLSCRWRPRTLNYRGLLPYTTESRSNELDHLNSIIKALYIAVESDDLNGTVGQATATSTVHWTVELKAWLNLKFDLPFDIRLKLAKFYYHLALSGAGSNATAKFVDMFCKLVEDEQFLRNVDYKNHLQLDWRPMITILRRLTINVSAVYYEGSVERAFGAYSRLGHTAKRFWPPEDTKQILEKLLPMFTIAKSSISHNLMSLVYIMLPPDPVHEPVPSFTASDFLPTLFHLWGLNQRSGLFDYQCLEILSGVAANALVSPVAKTGKYGIMTSDQLSVALTATLRLLEVPVSYAGSPYIMTSETIQFDKNNKGKTIRPAAVLVAFSMIGEKPLEKGGILERLEDFIHSIESFCHPSNHGTYTKSIMNTVTLLVEHVTARWIKQESGESLVPKDRYLTEQVKDRFVKAVRNVAFLGIYSKSSAIVAIAFQALHNLAYLSPDLIIPRLLKEIYPSLQGLNETHRTMSSLKALNQVVRIISRTRRYAFHLTTLLTMALPGIDPNDLSKTLQSFTFIQTAALNVPFYDLSEGMGTELAMQYVSADMEYLQQMPDDGSLPGIPDDVALDDIIKSSSAAFAELVPMILGRVLNLLENLPDQGTDKKDSPEAHVVNTLPPTMCAVLGAVSEDLYDTLLKNITDFVANTVINSATDAMAQLCGSLVKVRPDRALSMLLPVLFQSIRYEVEENGAGSTRSKEILPRDRPLIWAVSALNMSLAHAGDALLPWIDELTKITVLLREKCKGSIVFHTSNTIHHTLTTLTTTFVRDYALVDEEQDGPVQLKHWGYRVDPSTLNIKWHVPNEPQVQAAYDLYKVHCDISFKNIKAVIKDSTTVSGKKGSVTTNSDILMSNLTYLRTSTGGMALLFDPKYSKPADAHDEDLSGMSGMEEDTDISDSESEGDDEADDDYEEEGEEDDDDDDEGPIGEMKKIHVYPVGYFFSAGNTDHPIYAKVNDLRLEIGRLLHEVHEFLTTLHDFDVASFKALMFAFKVWFADVGIERTARQLETLRAFYKYDSKYFKVNGLRKDYPRPVLARRAGLYHQQRLHFNTAPNPGSELEHTLLADVVTSSLSVYADIRRNAQGALDMTLKVLRQVKKKVYGRVLQDMEQALHDQDFDRADSGLRLMTLRRMNPVVKRDYHNYARFLDILDQCVRADHRDLSNHGHALSHDFLTALTMPCGLIKDTLAKEASSAVEPLVDQGKHLDDRITKIRATKVKTRQEVYDSLTGLLQRLYTNDDEHWKLVLAHLTMVVYTSSVPVLKVDPKIADKFMPLLASPHRLVKTLANHGVVKTFQKILRIAAHDHDIQSYALWYNEFENVLPGQHLLDTNQPDTTSKVLKEFSMADAPSFFMDKYDRGWLVWPDNVVVEDVDLDRRRWFNKLDENDIQALKAIGGYLTKEWLGALMKRMQTEESSSSQDKYDHTESLLLVVLFCTIELEYAPIDFDTAVEVAKENFDPEDKNSHRFFAQFCGAMCMSLPQSTPEVSQAKLEFVTAWFAKVIQTNLAVDNVGYWTAFISGALSLDHRRIAPVLDVVTNFQLDPDLGTQVFKESSKISFVRHMYQIVGWKYQRPDLLDTVDDFWSHVDHPLDKVRDGIAKTLASIYKSRYLEGFQDVDTLLTKNTEAGDLGLPSWKMHEALKERLLKVFDRLEQWRTQRDQAIAAAGAQQASEEDRMPYIRAGKTLIVFLDRLVKSNYGVALVPLFPDTIFPALLQFLNVRDEQDMMTSTLSLIRSIGNLPYPLSSLQYVIDLIVKYGTSESSTWRQRLSILNYTQTFFFRQLFIMTPEQRQQLVDSVVAMLQDAQLEVRSDAAVTLAGIIRCSAQENQAALVSELERRFTKLLGDTQQVRNMRIRSHLGSGIASPISPSRPRQTGNLLTVAATRAASGSSASAKMDATTPATPHTENVAQLLVQRHAAVLGLGSLVQAFPYLSPPPAWIPRVLSKLANRAANDPGMVGKSVKTTLGDFKKTRQDTWHVDVNSFTQEQLDDLDGVLWKNYFV